MEEDMHPQPSKGGFAQKRLTLSAIVAVFVGGLLLGGSRWLMNMNPSQPHPASTPVVSPLTSENVYLVRSTHVVKLDGRTGRIIWQQSLPALPFNAPRTCVQIVGGVMYIILDSDAYAFQTSDGKPLWQSSTPHTGPRTQGGVGNQGCQMQEGRIYIHHDDGTYAILDAQDGTQIWRRIVVKDSFEVQHGAIYSETHVGESILRFTARDATTGTERWQTDLQPVNTSFLTRVVDGMVYHAAGDALYALSETTGRLIWQQHTQKQGASFADSSLANGVLYVSTSAPLLWGGGKQDPQMDVAVPWYRISAFDAKKGTL